MLLVPGLDTARLLALWHQRKWAMRKDKNKNVEWTRAKESEGGDINLN